MLLEVLTEKLIGDAKFHAGIAGLQDPQGADPGVKDLGGEFAFERVEQPVVEVVAHGKPSYGEVELHTHLSTAVDNLGAAVVVA